MKISFIGCGNMAKAMIGGLIKSGKAGKDDICASDPLEMSRKKAEEEFGIHMTADNKECVRGADVVIMAVKPQFFAPAAAEVAEVLTDDQLLISIAAGVTHERIESFFGTTGKHVRVMPNTPALVGQGIAGWCGNGNVTDEDKKTVDAILTSFGEAEEIPESLMGVVTSLSGSSPAYVFMFIEAMADAAVQDGMPRQKAYHFAAQTVKGAAEMVLRTGRHPGELKDMVTSPAGTTIAGVASLESNGFRGTVMEAVHACTEKALNM